MTSILVVDDAVDATEVLGALFEACGHEAHLAFNGQEAVEQAERHVPHIIFLDLDMPVLDGFGAARAIRRSPDTDHPFIIALTGKVDPDLQRKTAEAGFDFYLRKPADTNALLILVDDLQKRAHPSAQAE